MGVIAIEILRTMVFPYIVIIPGSYERNLVLFSIHDEKRWRGFQGRIS